MGDSGNEICLELLQPPLVRPIAKRVDGPVREAHSGDREPEVPFADLDMKRCRRNRGRSRGARNRDDLRERIPAGQRFLYRKPQHCLGRDTRYRLSGRVPELNCPVRVDEKDAVGDVAEHQSSLPPLLGFASRRMLAGKEGIALLPEANAFQRMADALHDRLEQGDFPLVEALVVETCNADHAAIDLSGKRRQDELTDPDREGIVKVQMYLLRPQGARTAFVFEQVCSLVGRETVGAHECANASAVGFRQDERDLGLEGLAELGGEKLAQLGLGSGGVDNRDDLRSPGRLDEAPKQLVPAVNPMNRMQRRRGYSCGLLSHPGSGRSLRVCRYLRLRAEDPPLTR